ncbi:hypothetical protein [Rhizobium terrae]|uniref:hypothetical protein n=1 Tax=Rhizobium terrae TaxID=2171756 RepID=UPI000E3B58E7|nr:hypothetical protein [Rhizobium terrae]
MNAAVLTNTFEPSELAFLQRFFDDFCAEHGLAGGSHGANDLAARIIALYQQGVRDEKNLHFQLSASVAPKS